MRPALKCISRDWLGTERGWLEVVEVVGRGFRGGKSGDYTMGRIGPRDGQLMLVIAGNNSHKALGFGPGVGVGSESYAEGPTSLTMRRVVHDHMGRD